MSGFFYEFCKADFLCYAGEPHWVGWIVLIILFFGILYLILRIVTSEAFQENSESYFDEKSTKQQEIYKDSQGNPFIDSEGNPVQQKWIDKHLGKIGFLISLIVIWSLWFIALD